MNKRDNEYLKEQEKTAQQHVDLEVDYRARKALVDIEDNIVAIRNAFGTINTTGVMAPYVRNSLLKNRDEMLNNVQVIEAQLSELLD